MVLSFSLKKMKRFDNIESFSQMWTVEDLKELLSSSNGLVVSASPNRKGAPCPTLRNRICPA
jgi:hypothetical protein